MSDELFHTLVLLEIEKQEEKDFMIKEIQELEQKLLDFKNNHYELHGEIESLEHVIELLNDDKDLKQKLNALHGKKG